MDARITQFRKLELETVSGKVDARSIQATGSIASTRFLLPNVPRGSQNQTLVFCGTDGLPFYLLKIT